MQPHLPRLADAGASGFLQRPEAAAEVELLVVGDVLVAEHQHAVLGDRVLDRVNRRGRQGLAQVDIGDLGDKDRVQGTDVHAKAPWVEKRPLPLREGAKGSGRGRGKYPPNYSAARNAGAISNPTPFSDVRRRSRFSFRSRNARARCMTVRLSHITMSPTRHSWE